MKKKIKNRLAITFGLTAMLGVVSLGVIHDVKQYENKENIVKVERQNKVQPKYVSYDDEYYKITLTADELNNYLFPNLTQYLEENVGHYPIESIVYNDNEFYVNSGTNTTWIYDSNYVIYIEDNYFCYDEDDETYVSFEYSIKFNIETDYYNDVKSAIELDIQANQPVNQGESIIGAITSGLGLIPDLTNEFLTGFSALFWNSQTSSLTTFSYFALVFLGIAITMAIVKLVLAIIRGNTGA